MSTTTSTPGNIVVPLSTILDQLQGKLTGTEIDQLVGAILGISSTDVRPGDRITAARFNAMQASINDLLLRVAKLEGVSTGPRLLGLSPTGDIPLLSALTVLGTGFDTTLSNNTVMLGTVAVTTFLPGSTANQLVLQVPDLFPSLPALVQVSVRAAGQSSNALQVRLIQAVSQQGGQVVITSKTPALGTITVGSTYTLQWSVDAQTALPATYTMQLVFTNVGGATAAAWAAASVLRPSGPQQIVLGSPLPVSASVTIPAAASQASIALQVQSADGLFNKTSDPVLLQVGAAPQISDPRATVKIGRIGPVDAGGNPNPLRTAKITIDGNQLDGLQLLFGKSGNVPVTVGVGGDASAAGDYFFSAQVEDAGAPWQVSGLAPTSSTNVATQSTRAVTLTLSNTDAARTAAVTFLVIRAEHHPVGAPAGDFVSFVRVPIQGVAA